MRKSKAGWLLIPVFLLNMVSVALGADDVATAELLKEIKALKSRVAELEARILKQESIAVRERAAVGEDKETSRTEESGPPSALEGIRVGAGATFIIQGTINANNNTGKNEDLTDATYSADLSFEKEFGDWGLALVHLETGDGQGVEDELEVFSNVNRDADDSDNAVNLTQAFYEHYLIDKQLTLTAGKIDPTCYVDQNELANCECTQFLGRIFRNAPTIDFCDNNAGVHFLFIPEEISWLGLEGQVLDGNGDWEDIADNIFATGQLNLRPALPEGVSGNYRVYGWYKDTDYSSWSDPAQTAEHKYGFGLSLDHPLTEDFTVFGRYGWCDPDLYDTGITSSSGANYSLEHTWSAGLRLEGKPWGRDEDHLAAAVGMVIPSDKYKDATGRTADDEGHIEAYYSWSVNQHLTLSPDLQIIWNPFGNGYTVDGEKRDDLITVIGCRGQVDI